jgi:mannose-6-phosphate isomerase-like protein (cupin superfamily)
MEKNQTRRSFLRKAPLAAAASIPLAERVLFASSAGSPEIDGAGPESSQLFTAANIADSIMKYHTHLGEHYLYQPNSFPLSIAMTTQETHSAGEFEYHEGRDHIFLILEGATKFEVGGKPRDARNTKPGEWLAPASEGATVFEVKKGDMLVIPRGTPHRQSTEREVTWMLISPSGLAKA